MNRIIDRILLLLLALISIAGVSGDKIIYTVLSGIIYTGLSYCYYDRPYVHRGLCIGMCLMILWNDLFTPLLVSVIYESVSKLSDSIVLKKKGGNNKDLWEIFAALITVALYILLYCAVGHRYIMEKMLGQIIYFILFAVSCVAAVYIAYISGSHTIYRKENLRLRDDYEEYRQLMLQKNRLMIKQQDSEIAMATLKERNRIAREIHDNVGHLLSRSILQMGALMAVYKDEPINSMLKDVNATLNESMTSIRNNVHNLHNESIDLERTLRDIIEDYREYEVVFDYEIKTDMGREIKYTIISIFTEAFHNIKKHSDADKVEILLREHPGFYQMIIRDNGKKIQQKTHNSGIGLHNMESRINELKGHIFFSSDNGFRIFITIPKKEVQNESSNS